MQVIPPDFDRLIDLHGVGPTPRPVDIDQGVTGFEDLVSLRIYDFAAGTVIDGEAEDDEVIVTLLSGDVTIAVTGLYAAEFTLRNNGDRAIYLPAQHHYRLSPRVASRVAYARARPGATGAPCAFAPTGGALDVGKPLDRLRLRVQPLGPEADASAGLGDGVERLACATGPARVREEALAYEVGAFDTLALSPGEAARAEAVDEGGELLVVSALRPPA